jgi:hypothetical protein
MKTNHEYTEKYQTITLLTAIAAGEYWSVNDINDMRDLKKSNVSNLEIAQLLGRSYYSICTKLSLVGLDGDVSVMFGNRRNNRKPNDYGVACSTCFMYHTAIQVDCA